MNTLDHKRILLGITGGIAAYKSAELVRRLREQGAELRVVMTRSAERFIGALTLHALCGHPVFTEGRAESPAMAHIELARWADLILIAPASAHLLARLAHGLADDLLSSTCLAAQVPLALAPAMNREMWLAAATQSNRELLEARGAHILGPESGDQACGEVGPGRMLEPADLVAGLNELFASGALAGLHVVITAGPTREAIDPVRFLSNYSSGKMGYALARAAREAGARVTLISGPVSLTVPAGVEPVAVTSAAEMQAAVMQRVNDCDVFVAAAAVADFCVAGPMAQKLKRAAQPITLHLMPTPDVLAAVVAVPKPPFTVGFAAETEHLLEQARRKLAAKSVDMLVANQVGRPGLGFDSDDNEVHVLWPGGVRHLAKDTKERLARTLITLIAQRYRAKDTAQAPRPAFGS